MTLHLFDDDAQDLTGLGGMVGVLNLYEESPRLNPARVRPFIYSILLLRGGVRPEEVISSLSPHAHPDDLRVWDDDYSPLDVVVRHTLNVMVQQSLLRRRDDDLYVLDATPEASRKAISITATLDGQLPDHMLAEMGRTHCALQS